jgi:hypothetical protein
VSPTGKLQTKILAYPDLELRGKDKPSTKIRLSTKDPRCEQTGDHYILKNPNQHGGYSEAKNRTPYDPAIPFLGIYPKECKSAHNRDATCTPMFIAALFRITMLSYHPKCSKTYEWVKKMLFRYI